MDYGNFKEQFVEDVKERLYEQGTEVDITVNTVNKLNESYEAMTVKPEGSNIGVNIGIDKLRILSIWWTHFQPGIRRSPMCTW